MKKSISFLLIILLSSIQSIYPVAAGMFLYRYNSKKEVEILFALDTNQHHASRLGFEQPGGKIGDHLVDGKIDSRDPRTFLSGAIRETLEELMFIPAEQLALQRITQNKHNFTNEKHSYTQTAKSLCINKQFEQDAVNQIKYFITNIQGLFYLYNTQHHPYTVFFWNVSDFCTRNLPQDIVVRRIALKQKYKNLRFCHDLHAEPIAFAWVKAKDLLETCRDPQKNWVKATHYAEYDTKHNSYVSINDSTQRFVNTKTKEIQLSPGCIQLMQPHGAPVIFEAKRDGTFKIYDAKHKDVGFAGQPKTEDTSSDMLTILLALSNKK